MCVSCWGHSAGYDFGYIGDRQLLRNNCTGYCTGEGRLQGDGTIEKFIRNDQSESPKSGLAQERPG